MLKAIFVITCCVIAAANVIPIAEVRIINGQSAHPGQIPFHALIWIFTPNETLYCGGVLISSIWVLTAAHCVSVNHVKPIEVHLGATTFSNIELGGVIQKPQKVIVHEEWDPFTVANDIALVKLSKPIEFSPKISAISLPKSTMGNFEGETLIASGFGRHSMSDPSPSVILQYAPHKVISNDECIIKINVPLIEIKPTNICAIGEKFAGACKGDSGGPLYHNGTKPILVGITSFGKRPCSLGTPSAYTRVSKYLDWISKNTGIPV